MTYKNRVSILIFTLRSKFKMFSQKLEYTFNVIKLSPPQIKNNLCTVFPLHFLKLLNKKIHHRLKLKCMCTKKNWVIIGGSADF